MRRPILGIAAIAALAVALPTTASWAGKGPYWNCYGVWPGGATFYPPESFPRWTKAQAIQHVLGECRHRCKISQCFHESGDAKDPSCKHCVPPRAVRPSAFR